MLLAPICLFVYNRPSHTLETLKALKESKLSDLSDLYIFCDGPKPGASIEDKEKISKVREVIRKDKWCKNIIIIESEKNKGLADSIISGVTKVINKHGSVIVLEDDLLSGKCFLQYMNDALKKYQNNSNIVQISGYSFPVKKLSHNHSTYCLPIISTWGWATWETAWKKVDFSTENISIKNIEKKKFNFYNSYPYLDLLKNHIDKNVNSWGILFYYHAYSNNKIVVYPDNSLVRNIGWDATGKHGATYELYPISNWIEEYKINKFCEAKIDVIKERQVANYLKRKNSYLRKIILKIGFILKKM